MCGHLFVFISGGAVREKGYSPTQINGWSQELRIVANRLTEAREGKLADHFYIVHYAIGPDAESADALGLPSAHYDPFKLDEDYIELRGSELGGTEKAVAEIIDSVRVVVATGGKFIPRRIWVEGGLEEYLRQLLHRITSAKTITRARGPFHETLVDAIRRCNPNPSSGEILRLFDWINSTKIPAGHDAIVEAIDWYFNFPGAAKWAREIVAVKAGLREQKQAAPKEVKSFSAEDKERALMTVIGEMLAECQNSQVDNFDQRVFKLFERAKAIKRAETDADFQAAIADQQDA